MEAKIRWKDNRNLPHLDLCRPFAAHCCGYPMVTLGFGFKSYIGYRIRQRKQREVAKENEFYMQLLQQALPQEEMEKSEEQAELSDSLNASSSSSSIPLCKNTQQQNSNHQQNANKVHSNGSIEHHQLNGSVNTTNSKQQNLNKKNLEKENGCLQHNHHSHNHNHNHTHHLENNHQEIIPNNAILSKSTSSKASNHLNYNNLQSGVKNTNTTSYQQIQNGIASPIIKEMQTKELNVPAKCSPYKNKSDDHNTYIATTNKKEYEKEKIIKDSNSSYEETSTEAPSHKVKVKSERQQQQQQQPSQQKDNQQYHQQHHSNVSANGNLNNSEKKVCEQCQRLDQDSKRLKSEMQTIKSLEQEVRQKYENVKGCLQTKQKECEDLQKQ